MTAGILFDPDVSVYVIESTVNVRVPMTFDATISGVTSIFPCGIVTLVGPTTVIESRYVIISVLKLNGSQSHGSADDVTEYLYGSAEGIESVNLPRSRNLSNPSTNTLPRQ